MRIMENKRGKPAGTLSTIFDHLLCLMCFPFLIAFKNVQHSTTNNSPVKVSAQCRVLSHEKSLKRHSSFKKKKNTF